MNLWIARPTHTRAFIFYKMKPIARPFLNSESGKGFDIFYYPQPTDTVICTLFDVDKLFPELTSIQIGSCVQIEFNNDCFRILGDGQT